MPDHKPLSPSRDELLKALEDQASVFGLVLEQSLAGYWDWRIQEGYEYLSPTFKKMFGYEDHELENAPETWQRLIFSEDLPGVMDVFERHVRSRGEVPFYNEVRYRHKDGSTVWVICTGNVIEWDDAGRPVRMVGCHVDITQRKRVEQDLREREGYLQKIFDILPVGLWLADKDGTLLRGNPAGVALWGGEPKVGPEGYGVFKARRLPFGQEIAPDDWALAHTIRRGATILDEELEIDALDGKKRIILNSTAPVRNDQGELCGAVVVNQDITERKAAEDRLLKAMMQAEAANRVKSSFLGIMSHEIRTPLNGIMGMLQLLDDSGLDEEQGQYVRTAFSASRILTQVLADVLDIANLESGEMALRNAPFCLRQVLGDVREAFAAAARVKNLELTVEVASDVPQEFMGDAARLRQVLSGLVSNSIKFSESGRVRIEAYILPYGPRPGRNLHLAVADTGSGIALEQVKDIFEPFIQLDGVYTRRKGGAGLGLSIARRIVKLMGGTLSVCSEPGWGTEVHMTLPGGALPRDGHCAARHPAGDLAGKSLRILLVEDERVNRMAACRLLERDGHAVTEAEDGQSALEALKQAEFDAILMDIQMPGMDGTEVTRAIRTDSSLGAKSNLPIIAVTAHAMLGDRERFIEAGMDGYLSKPLLFDELRQELTRLCGTAN